MLHLKWFVWAGAALAVPLLQQAPVFKARVDLVTADVVVLDRDGAPVPGLTAADFVVEAGRRPRRIVSVDYVSATPPARDPRWRAAPGPSTNTQTAAARTIVFVADLENILAGDARAAFKSVADHLARLAPEDRAGLVVLPGGARIEPTTDRASVRDAIAGLSGTSQRLRDREMTFGEAAGVAVNDVTALAAYWYRIAEQGFEPPGGRSCSPPPGPFERPRTVPPVCLQAAERVLERVRFSSRAVIRALTSLAQAMAPLGGTKALVLVSGGVYTDPQVIASLAELAVQAERSRTAVYALMIEAPAVEASSGMGPTTQTKRLDNQIGLAGLAEIAGNGRGTAERVLGGADAAMARIDRELSGHYVIAFERDDSDRDGERVSITVRTTRSGVRVLARKEFTPAAAVAAAARDSRSAVAALLRSPAADRTVPLDVDSYALPAGGGDDVRVLLAIDVARPAADVAAFGFQVADPSGAVVADGFEARAAAQPRAADRGIVIVPVTLRAGRYVARIAVVDAQGSGGSVQHAFDVAAWLSSPLRVSDLIAGEFAGDDIRPIAALTAGAPSIALRLVVRDESSRFDEVTVRVDVHRATDNVRVGGGAVPLQKTPDPLRRLADLELSLATYDPGEYVAVATVTAGTRVIAQRVRLFRK